MALSYGEHALGSVTEKENPEVRPAAERGVRNALTIDVEEWFHVSLFRNIIPNDCWDTLQSTVVENINKCLALLAEVRVRATFYILGWVAERYPEVVIAIKEQGHEIASHGYAHKIAYEQSKQEFADDVERSLRILSAHSGGPILSYRAPSYSITGRNLWALEVLAALGLKYDSSIFPIKHDIYGIPNAPRFPFEVTVNGTTLIEFPLSTVRFMRNNIPVAGGAYLRLYPLWFIRAAIRSLNKAGMPVVLYFHPWELDERQPRQPVPWIVKLRHYSNIDVMAGKLRTILSEFEFAPVQEVLGEFDRIGRWPL